MTDSDLIMNTEAASALEQAASLIEHFADGTNLVDILHALQASIGFVPPQMVPLISEKSGEARPAIYKAIELSPSFTLIPPGKHLLYICSADNCCSKGALALAETARQTLGVNYYQCDAEQTVRLEPFRCLGNCINGPNISLDGKVQGPVTPAQLTDLLQTLLVTR
jgi:formate dehydrogenase subunit gamma